MHDFFRHPVVCNTGPLLGLSRVGLVGLLGKLFPEVIVPREVAEEILLAPRLDTEALTRELARFSIPDAEVVTDPLLRAELDRGEAAVITTARTRGLSGVIMDERKGRRIASMAYGLHVKGTAGLLVAAKEQGHIVEVRPILAAMKSHGYFLGQRLVEECLRQAGEFAA